MLAPFSFKRGNKAKPVGTRYTIVNNRVETAQVTGVCSIGFVILTHALDSEFFVLALVAIAFVRDCWVYR